MAASCQTGFCAGGGDSGVGNGIMTEGFYNLLCNQNFRTTIAMAASCQTGFCAGGGDSGVSHGSVAQLGVYNCFGVCRITVCALSRFGAVLGAGGVAVVNIILEGMR